MENIYRSFYTKNSSITDYMVKMIKPQNTDKILEPCGGDGAFIDSLIKINPNFLIDTCDLNPEAIKTLSQKYHDKNNVNIRLTDTLFDTLFDGYSQEGYYDKIIGNPPYGGWLEMDVRARLKQKYNKFYVKETYSLFLLRCVSLLKNGGILSFIIPDTFLFLNNHKQLRKYLLKNTKIIDILIFPSRLFPGVSFGYSNLSIITLKKSNNETGSLNNVFRVIQGIKTDVDFENIEKENYLGKKIFQFKQRDVFEDDNHALIMGNDNLRNIIRKSENYLGDFADCVTGIYTGNNSKYLGVLTHRVKNSKNYLVIPNEKVDTGVFTLKGIEKEKFYIPVIKGSSSSKYIRKEIDWLIRWDKKAIEFYNSDKKARFQNSSYYFKKGVALPMVKSSNINATLIENRVFDQSIVGIFPKDNNHLNFILGFLNSDIANKLIHLINPTANNSANYLKRLPLILPTKKEKIYIDQLVEEVIKTQSEELIGKINDYFNTLYETTLGN